MIKPYYEEKGITIYHGDCRNILPQLELVDLVLTDPPYGIDGEEPISEISEVFYILKTMATNSCVIMDWRNNSRIDSVFGNKKIGELVWEYGWVSGGRTKAKSGFFPTHNTIGLYGNKVDFNFIKGSIIKRQPGFSSPRQCSYAKKSGHPYEKPVKLMQYLLQHINAVKVLDPFVGSGTTLLSARRMNRKAIGIEIEEKYCEIAAKRLQQEVFSLE